MPESGTRPPTPAVSHASPLIEYSNGSLYPVWNFEKGGLNAYLDAIRRVIAPINPFAHQQVPTTERVGLMPKLGAAFYQEQPYPSGAFFDRGFPSHYDPLKDARFKPANKAYHVNGHLTQGTKALVPRFCERQIRKYKTCLVANDQQDTVCKEEQDNIIAICPQWALHNLKQKKLSILKDEALSNEKYREVMQVSSYNKGRTVADVPLRSWSDGSRENLRPATLWADDRYIDITPEEIQAAKQRVKKRRQANPNQHPAHLPHYDRTFEVPPTQVPLYS